MNSARQPSLFFFSLGRGKARENCSLTRPVFLLRVLCWCCDECCVLQPEGIDLYRAASAGKLDEVEAAVDAGASMEWANSDRWGQRAVAIASERGHKDVVAFLGSRGADVNAVGNGQWTPLHSAAQQGRASVCTALLALGADPAAKNKIGQTALDKAREWNKPECVAVLEAAMR